MPRKIDINQCVKLLALGIIGLVVVLCILISAADIVMAKDIPGIVYAIDFYAVVQSIAILGFHGGSETAKNGNGNSNGNGAH